MTQLGSLEAKLDVNSASFVSGMKRAADATERTANAVDRGMASMKRSVAGLGGLIAADKAIEGARKYLELADSAKMMTAQLKLATAQFGNMGVAQSDVNRVARETRSGLTEITSLYGKMLPAANNLGKGQADAARATETFTKALKIGGAGTNEAASATLQFGQALASGVLRGDEFNSINEASPRIMRLLADSMGVPVGAMRKMAEEGKLTSDVLFKALTDPKFTGKIDQEFKELPLTFGEAIVQAQNAATQMVGAFDKGSGISTAISESIGEGTETLAHLVNTAEEAGQDIRADFAALYDVFSPMLAGGNSMFDMLGARTASFADQVRSILSGIDQVRNFLPNLQNAANKWDREHLGDTIYTRGLKDAPTSNLEGQFNARHARYKHTSARERIIGSINQYEPGYDTKGKSDAQLIAKANDVAGKVRKGEYTAKGTGKNLTPPQEGKKKPKKKGKDPAKEAEREAEKHRRDLESFTHDIDRLQSHELDSRAALATTASERFAFERQALEQDRKTEADRINKDGPEGSKRYNQAQVDQLKALNDKIAANKAEAVNLREAQFNSEEELKLKQSSLANAQDVAQLQSSMARTAKDRRAAELRILDLQMEQERLALEAIIASRDSTDADKEIAKARLRMLPALRAAQGKQVEQQTQGPLQAYLDAIPRTKDEINEALEGVSVDGLQSLESGLVDAVRGVGSLGDAFGKLADTVISDLARIAIQQMIIKPLGSLLFGGQDSGGGGLFGSLVKGFTSAVIGGATGGLTGGITAPSMSIPTSSILAPGMITPNLSGFRANGGYTAPGTYMVGERGPELVEIGQQANVVPAQKTKAMMGSNAAPAVNVTFGSITSNDPATVKAVAMQAITETMPIIVSQAKAATYRDANRPKLR